MTVNTFRYPAVGYCIYCGAQNGPLSDEHIVPLSLNGAWILPKASCESCSKITQRFEQTCTHESGGMFAAFRARIRLRSRRKWTSRNEVFAAIEYPDGTESKLAFKADSFPAVAYGIECSEAGVLLGEEPSDTKQDVKIVYVIGKPRDGFEMPNGTLTLGTFYLNPFLRLLAKIALSFAIASGVDRSTIHPMLADNILGRTDKLWYLIGGGWPKCEPEYDGQFGHGLRLRRLAIEGAPNTLFTVVLIHLFGQFGLPRYHVVVCQRPFDQRAPVI